MVKTLKFFALMEGAPGKAADVDTITSAGTITGGGGGGGGAAKITPRGTEFEEVVEIEPVTEKEPTWGEKLDAPELIAELTVIAPLASGLTVICCASATPVHARAAVVHKTMRKDVSFMAHPSRLLPSQKSVRL